MGLPPFAFMTPFAFCFLLFKMAFIATPAAKSMKQELDPLTLQPTNMQDVNMEAPFTRVR